MLVLQGETVRSIDDLDIGYTLCTHVSQNIVFGGTTTEFVKMWDFRMQHPCICVIHAHNDIVSSISCSPDGRKMLSLFVFKNISAYVYFYSIRSRNLLQ